VDFRAIHDYRQHRPGCGWLVAVLDANPRVSAQYYPDDFGFSTTNHIVDHYNNDITSGDQTFDPPPKLPEPPAK
jgi:hypothetical protein